MYQADFGVWQGTGGFHTCIHSADPSEYLGGFIPFIHSNTHGKISGGFHTVPYIPIPFKGGYNSRAMLLSHLDFSVVCVRNVFPHVRESHGRKTS